jgi:hypothetical protein
MGFFKFNQDQPDGRLELTRQAWIYLASALPPTLLVLVASFAWMWWTRTKEKRPFDSSAGQALVRQSKPAIP